MNRMHLLGYLTAAAISAFGIHRAMACTPIQHCSGTAAWNTSGNQCHNLINVIGSDGSGTKFVGVSLQNASGFTSVDGNISGTHNGSVLSGCAATDTTVDGNSVTATTNCGTANGYGYSADYCQP